MTRTLHERITCRRLAPVPGPAGEYQESWAEIATVWAAVRSRPAAQVTRARQSHILRSYRVRLRHQDALLATRNVLWRGRAYRVVGLQNPDSRNRLLEFDMVEDYP